MINYSKLKNIYYNYKMDLEKLYLESLDEKEKIAYNIAKSHLGTLFSLVKSNDFIEWLEKRTNSETNS
jgi:hypothetical protein